MSGPDEPFFYGAPGVAPAARASGSAPAGAPAPAAGGWASEECAAPAPAPARGGAAEAKSWAAVAGTGGAAAAAAAEDAAVAAAAAAAADAAAAAAAAASAPPAADRAVCSFFAAGKCRFGSSCRFAHVAPPSESLVAYFASAIARARESDGGGDAGACAPPSAPSPAAAAAAAAGAGGDDAAAAAAWQASALTSSADGLVAAALAAGVAASAGEAEAALQAAEAAASAGVACGICFEAVLDARAPDRRFGLLTACSHAFCLECIRGWRSRVDLPRETVRSCPVCRRTSYCVVPCARLLTDAARKAAANAGYERVQARIACRYYDGGRGDCPFGSSCRYAHTRPDGSEHVYSRPPLRLDADGGATVARATKLNEFFA